MRSYIFDFDGVLADTFEPIVNFANKYLFMSKEVAGRKVFSMTQANHRDSLIERFAKNLLALPLDKYLAKRKEDIVFVERLDELKKIQAPKAILTNNYSFICRDILGVETDLFEMIIGGDTVGTKIQGLEIIFQNPNFIKEDCVFITDTVGDILEIKKVLSENQIYAAGWGFHSKKLLKRYLPENHILKDFKSLENLLVL